IRWYDTLKSLFIFPAMQDESKTALYRTERLPIIYPYHLRAENRWNIGDLVYYGPCPGFYGIGEIVAFVGHVCVVDFRGTGELQIHKDAIEKKYLIPIHTLNLSHLLTER